MQTNKKVIPIFFAVDDAYAPYAAVAIKSVIENSNADNEYHIYLLVSSIETKNKNIISGLSTDNVRVSFVDVSQKVEQMGNLLHTRDYYTNTTYYRFFIPELFPNYQKGVYLDSDIVATRDIADLFGTELGNNVLAAVTDEVVTDIPVFSEYSQKFLGIEPNRYFNAGILVMNLKLMRQIGFEKRVINFMKRYKFTVAQDQDYLNVLCAGRVEYLSLGWNKTPFPNSNPAEVPHIIHFKLNFKPWHYSGILFEEYFWKYAKNTPYYSFLLSVLDNYSDAQKQTDSGQYSGLEALALSEIERASAPDYIKPAEVL